MPQPGVQKENHYGLMSIGSLYNLLFCSMASTLLLSMPILGGAFFLIGQTAILFAELYRPVYRTLLSKGMRMTGHVLLAISFALSLVMIMIYPVKLNDPSLWRLTGLVFCILMRPALLTFSLEKSTIEHRKTMGILWRLAVIELAFIPPIALMLFLSDLPLEIDWSLLVGFIISAVMESFSLGKFRYSVSGYSPEEQESLQKLRHVNAYHVNENIGLLVAAAFQLTQIMIYAYVVINATGLWMSMTIALLCTWLAWLATSRFVRRRLLQNPDPMSFVSLGLILWSTGLILFINSLKFPETVGGYLSLALCTIGATICVRVQGEMEADMRRMAAFGVENVVEASVDVSHHIRLEFASQLGQLLAVVGLALIGVFTSNSFPDNLEQISRAISPLLAVPALSIVSIAMVFVFLFPMTQEHLEKLRRYMQLRGSGEENIPLKKQLEAVVICKSLKHYGVKLIMMIMRPFFHHKILGSKDVQLDQDIPCIFVCNHGEIYGPIVTNLYVPFSFRPWVTYEMTDQKAVADRICNGIWKNVKPVWHKFLYGLTNHFLAPFSAWIMRSVGAIPVYHDNPRKLMQTFRETVAAMEAGDNILLFPEDPTSTEDGRYQREGVSAFFTGFTMVGQLYYNRTGNAPLFVPLYANKEKRTITFGRATRYNPDLPANEEKERLCQELRNEMLRLSKLDQ